MSTIPCRSTTNRRELYQGTRRRHPHSRCGRGHYHCLYHLDRRLRPHGHPFKQIATKKSREKRPPSFASLSSHARHHGYTERDSGSIRRRRHAHSAAQGTVRECSGYKVAYVIGRSKQSNRVVFCFSHPPTNQLIDSYLRSAFSRT